MLIPVLICAAAISQFEPRDPVPKSELKEYLRTTGAQRAKERHASAIYQADAKLSAAKKATIDKAIKKPVYQWAGGRIDSVVVGSAREKTKLTQECRDELKRLKDMGTLTPWPPRLPQATMRVGDAGALTMPINVIQVINSNCMLVASGQDELRRTFIVNISTAGYTDDETVSGASLL